MKNANKFLLFFALTFFFSSACQDFDDGPKVSIRSNESRIAGVWVVENAVQRVESQNQNWELDYFFDGITFYLNGEGRYIPEQTGALFEYVYPLQWEFDDPSNSLTVTFFVNQSVFTTLKYQVLKSTHRQLILQQDVADGYIRVQLGWMEGSF